MPIFMDRHELLGATARDLARAHQKDLLVQSSFQCRALTYWFDETRAVAFCLIEAPDSESVRRMHNKAHGMVPNRIIEVSSGVVEAFLGRISDPKSTIVSEGLQVFEDTAFRVLLSMELRNVAAFAAHEGVSACRHLLDSLELIMAEAVHENNGRKGTRSGERWLATFTSAVDAVSAALQIQRQLTVVVQDTNIVSCGVGLCAGDPVAEGPELFGEVIDCARRLCRLARDNRIVASSVVASEYRRETSAALGSTRSMLVLDGEEERFLNELMKTIEHSYMNSSLHIEELARSVGQSRPQLYRKLASLSFLSPKELIREFRLTTACELLGARHGNVTEVAFDTGFGSPAYFSKSFQSRFGFLPSLVLHQTH